MAKRSAWANQCRKEHKQLADELAQGIVSERGKAAINAASIGIVDLPTSLKNDIISLNATFLSANVRVLLRKSKAEEPQEKFYSKSELKELLQDKEDLNDMEAAGRDELTRSAIRHMLDNEEKEIPHRLESRVREYFKRRQIPLDKKNLPLLLHMYIESTGIEKLAKGIDLQEIERSYLRSRKAERTVALGRATEINMLLNKICYKIPFSANQRKTIKRWIIREYDEFQNKKIAAMKVTLATRMEGSHSDVDETEKEFVATARANFTKEFIRPETKLLTHKAPKPILPVKLGRREDRIANHVHQEKTPKQRNNELGKLQQTSRDTGKPFDTSRYCLDKIYDENPETAQLLMDMLVQGLINKSALTSLFTSGSLTQKIFTLTVKNPLFVKEFGESQFNVLAKGLAFIGPKGKEIERAKVAFQTPMRNQMFRFLELNGHLQTHHGGGDVVYLNRNGNVK